MPDALQSALVTVSITGDELDPEKITELLGGKPRRGLRRGEVFIDQRGKEITARTGLWYFGDTRENEPHVGQLIDSLLGLLTQDLDVWKSLSSEADCGISVGGYFTDWTGGVFLEPHTLKLLADRNLSIDFDLYAPAASQSEEMK